MSTLELGLDTFGDVTSDATGTPLSQAQVMRNVVAEAVLADQVGLDFFAIGEHHREDFAVSAPDVVLAAIAGQTSRIRLGSAVTVLSSDDPIRVFQRFSTLDAVSGGRAEVILGRGSFIESFPLFGYPLEQYEQLFEEKVQLFAELRKERPVTWSGTTRAPLTDQVVFPPTASGSLPTWIAVGGTPESVVRAAHYGFGLMLASTSTTARSRSSVRRRGLSACTPTATSPARTRRPGRSAGLTTSGHTRRSAVSAAGRR